MKSKDISKHSSELTIKERPSDSQDTKENHYSFPNLISDIKADIRLKSGTSFSKGTYYLLVSPSVKVVVYYRMSRFFYLKGFYWAAYFLKSMQSKYGCYISFKSVIKRRLRLVHPVGVVIGDGVTIEDDVSIWQNVTLGSHGKRDMPTRYPHVQSGVKIYAGAVVIGDIEIGENATVGANSVILSSVPSNSTAVGVPYKRKLSN